VRTVLFLGFAVLLAAACGGKDPMAGVTEDYPGATEYLNWKGYVLVRFEPVEYGEEDEIVELQRAVLLKRKDDGWKVLGESDEGFIRAREVGTFIPELDESGVEAFGLH
jgi:hypothetical protein